MQVRHKANFGLAEVDEALAEKLVASGSWEIVTEEKPAPRRGRKPAAETVVSE